jgi:hypothetical protein
MLRPQFTLLFCVLALLGYGQIASIGLIGSATEGNWDTDTPMVQDAMNPDQWMLHITLSEGEVKFRANGSWNINWGETAFPIGVGSPNGPNIPVPAGTYNITFNSATGIYFFDLISDIGIIGGATPFGWDREIFMYQSTDDPDQYSIVLNLIQSDARFRANGNWEVNWGAADFPSGIGTQDGPAIPIAQQAKYLILFNRATGVYNFIEQAEYSSIGVIGTATSGGWDAETALTRDAGNPQLWKGIVALTEGALRFRANNSWNFNWGGVSFPSGNGVLYGSDNIQVNVAGDYLIFFNTGTLEYSFFLIRDYDAIGLIGDATPNGAGMDTPMTQDPNDFFVWTLQVTLGNGPVRFRANNSWDDNWGGNSFPVGTAVLNGPHILVTAGDYFVTFNTVTLSYSFVLTSFSTIGIIGDATPGGWLVDTPMNQDQNAPSLWTLRLWLTDGGAKFRAENNWMVNWGSSTFPTGIGTQGGPNIPVDAGEYHVTFNSTTGAYSFEIIDTEMPTLVCFDHTVIFNGQQVIELQPEDLVSESDNANIQSISLIPASISCVQVGQIVPVIVLVTYVNGNSATCTGNVTVAGFPCDWSRNPNGVGCASGNDFTFNSANGVWTATSTNCYSAGAFTSDSHAFAQRQLCGNGSITVRVDAINGQGWAGLVMRETNAPGAKKAQLMTNLSQFSRREFRTATNGQALPQQFPSQNRYWLRIVRTGNQFVMYVSSNGMAWYTIGAQNIAMGNCIEMGLVTTNYTANSTVTTTFSSVSYTGSNPIALSYDPQAVSLDTPYSFEVYPNPTSGALNVDLMQYVGRTVRLDVYSINGKLLQFRDIFELQTTVVQLDLSNYRSGMYLVSVKSEGLPDVTRRIVLQ